MQQQQNDWQIGITGHPQAPARHRRLEGRIDLAAVVQLHPHGRSAPDPTGPPAVLELGVVQGERVVT